MRPDPSSPAIPRTSPVRIWRSSGATPDLRPSPLACRNVGDGVRPADSRTSCSKASSTASSRPIIFDTSSMRGSSAVRYSPTRRPLRSTVMRSAMRYTWSRKWVMNTTATPDARTRSTTSKSSSTSRVSRLDVGSSRISTWASISMARAIETSCWTAIECDSSGEAGSMSRCSCSRMAAARRRICGQLIRPNRRGSRPSIVFSATERFAGEVDLLVHRADPCRLGLRRVVDLAAAGRAARTSPASMR